MEFQGIKIRICGKLSVYMCRGKGNGGETTRFLLMGSEAKKKWSGSPL